MSAVIITQPAPLMKPNSLPSPCATPVINTNRSPKMNKKQGFTPLCYWGGKQRLLKHILPRIPKHQIYCEPFFGGGAVFWAKVPAAVECVNDLDAQIIEFYCVLKDPEKYEQLQTLISKTLHSRFQFKHASFIFHNPNEFTEIERAWAVWNSFCQSFAHKSVEAVSGRTGGGWGYCNGINKNRDIKKGNSTKIKDRAANVFNSSKQAFWNEDAYGKFWFCSRLETVQIECYDALKVIKSRDTIDTFFYLDPPYINTDCGSYAHYTESDYENLLNMLKTLKGKFMLSSFHNEFLRIFVEQNTENLGLNILEINQMSMAGNSDGNSTEEIQKGVKKSRKMEVLVMNYKTSDLI